MGDAQNWPFDQGPSGMLMQSISVHTYIAYIPTYNMYGMWNLGALSDIAGLVGVIKTKEKSYRASGKQKQHIFLYRHINIY